MISPNVIRDRRPQLTCDPHDDKRIKRQKKPGGGLICLFTGGLWIIIQTKSRPHVRFWWQDALSAESPHSFLSSPHHILPLTSPFWETVFTVIQDSCTLTDWRPGGRASTKGVRCGSGWLGERRANCLEKGTINLPESQLLFLCCLAPRLYCWPHSLCIYVVGSDESQTVQSRRLTSCSLKKN